jgi:hypothetical protein
MTQIPITKYHSILYKFFAILTCFGLFMGAMDILAIIHGIPLFLFKIPFTGISMIVPLIPVLLTILLSGYMAKYYRKMGQRWR